MSHPAKKVGSFEDILSANRPALLAYFQRRLFNSDDAADAFGVMLITAWKARRRMPDDPDAARMWLYGVARNVLHNTRRSLVRRYPEIQAIRVQLAALPANEPAPLHVEIREAVASLPEEDAELIRLTYWDGLASHEVAQLLGLNPSTVRSRLAKARQSLRVLLEREMNELIR